MSHDERFAHRLALKLGHPYPKQMLKGMSVQTYLGWMRYATLEPFDEQRADLRAGIIASTIANVMGGKKKGGKLWTPTDFMPWSEEPQPRKKTANDMFFQAKVLNSLMGGQYVDMRKPKKAD